MSDLLPDRRIIQQQEIAFNAAVAESNLGNLGKVVNHHTLYSISPVIWNANGTFGTNGPDTMIDLPRFVPWKCKVIGVFFSIELVGGVVTTVQITKATKPGAAETSILSTNASFSASAADNSRVGRVIRELEGDTVAYSDTNCTIPVIDQAVNTLEAGECLIMNITATDLGACNLTAQAFIQPLDQ